MEIRSAQAQKQIKLEVVRLDPYIICSANSTVAFDGTKLTLAAEASGTPVGLTTWQWQEYRDGVWQNCAEEDEIEPPTSMRYSFTAHEGMASIYRCVLDNGEEPVISENTVEITFIPDQDVELQPDAAVDGTSVTLTWNPDLKGLVSFAVYISKQVADSGEPAYGAFALVEEGIDDTQCVVDLLEPETNYRIVLGAVTPGRTITEFRDVQTGQGPAANDTVYRALLIGEVGFFGDSCTRNLADVRMLRSMLRQVNGACGREGAEGGYGVVLKTDLNPQEILDAVDQTFRDADENDVSLFFITTHGDVDDEGEQAGRLFTPPGIQDEDSLLLRDLADALLNVPGEVVVFLQSCGSGTALYEEAEAESAAAEWNTAVVQAFSQAESALVYPATGEFRNQKFHVLTASAYQQYSWGWEGGPDSRNYFTEDLIDGVLQNAAVNEKNQITLEALYRYIQQVGDPREYIEWDRDGKHIYQQNVQVWPEDCSDPLFQRIG